INATNSSKRSSARRVASTLSLIQSLDNGGDALSDADAHRCQAVTTAAPFQLVQQGHDDACATAAERVPQGDGAAVDVELLLVDLQLARTLQALCGKGFVELDQIDIVRAQSGALQDLARR